VFNLYGDARRLRPAPSYSVFSGIRSLMAATLSSRRAGMRDQRYATFGAARRAPASSLPDRPIGSHLLDPGAPIPANPKPISADVVSLDWKWLFIDPDQGVAAVNQLVAPAPELFNAINTTDPDNLDRTRGFARISKNSES
jgi:hypothetical protein